jgi:dihydrofolate reductase
MKKEIILIAAVAKNFTIGKENGLPWRLPKDMKFFAETTTGHTVIMGRKTWESIPLKYRPLPDRSNIVITRTLNTIEHGVKVFDDLQKAIDDSNGKIFICGGGEIYKQALPLATKLILTEVDAEVDGDTFFPDFDTTIFKEVSRISNPADEKHKFGFNFVTYDRTI